MRSNLGLTGEPGLNILSASRPVAGPALPVDGSLPDLLAPNGRGRMSSVVPRRCAAVIRISLPYICKLATDLEPLSTVKGGETIADHYFTLLTAEFSLDALVNNSVFASTLRSSRASAIALLTSIRRLTGDADPSRTLVQYEPISLMGEFQQFKIALLAEIGILPSYFVTQKGGFDTLTLLDWGHLVFPQELQQKVPEAIFDAQEAGKSLAFELPTAAGFHIFRATESVLRRYYDHVTSGKAPPKVRSIAIYVRQLRIAKCAEEIIPATLEQMAKLHRNPLIHPEVALTTDEAISTLGIARSAITAMLAVLPVLPPTTASP